MNFKPGEIVLIPQKNRKEKVGIVLERIVSDLGVFLGVYSEHQKFFIKEIYVKRR